MESKERGNAGMDPEGTSQEREAQERMLQGADADLLALFGLTRESDDTDGLAIIDSGRQEVFGQGLFTGEDIPGVDPGDPEILAVADHGDTVYPAFQFEDDGTILRPLVAEVNKIIKSAGDMSPWEHAFWWISNSGTLDGLTPMEVMMAGNSELLLEAVKQEIQPQVD